MNISLIDLSLATNDTVLTTLDDSTPMWDLMFAHQIGIASTSSVVERENNDPDTDESNITQ